ncbi:T9SS C-terminal target domain-containing protein [Chryseobacterium phosphatilyticum]|uniref:T9SS C-terminal target domain-containing protein n=1 Tax=Chryseobacterium phosphatilyticum TaxID=475075 RepID=A0A316X3T5_9FLAO|nr:T9SS type A sorting domain-containing protein [Chryseobacterium phosphatilyticum]PWN68415.1 T9SS C-terminal target domain-containing protein [Chryseobacterium phosphatilyticum]
MKKLLFSLFLFTIVFVHAQNDDCTGAISLTVGTDFTSGAITANNTGATTDGSAPSCNSDAVENVWFKVVVPQSGNLKIETNEASGSTFDDTVLNVYSGTCGALNEIDCDDDGGSGYFSSISLTGQTPGSTLYINVWKYSDTTDSGEFQISAYDPIPPANDNCSGAIPLTPGTDFASGATTVTNVGATTDGSLPPCNSDAVENVWFTVTVPQSGNLKIETQQVSGSDFDDSVLSVYSGTCGSLTEVGCDEDSGDGYFSILTLTGQTPGSTLYINVWKYSSSTDNGEFQISAYDDTLLSTQEVADNKKKITASPNPFSDQLTISDISGVQSISITDTSGKLVKTIEKPTSSLYLKDLKEGLYFVTLKMKDGSIKTIKTIKK